MDLRSSYVLGGRTGIFLRYGCAVLLALLVLDATLAAQQINLGVGKAKSATATPTPTATPSPSPTAIPLSALTSEAQSTSERLSEIKTKIQAASQNQTIREGIPGLKIAVEAKSAETNEILASRPSLDELTATEREWQGVVAPINGWKSELQDQGIELDKLVLDLSNLRELWQNSLDSSFGSAENVPPEILQRTKEILASISETQELADSRRADLLRLQTDLSDVGAEADRTRSEIKNARSAVLTKLLVRDSPAIWNIRSGELNGKSLWSSVVDTLDVQAKAFRQYVLENSGRFLLHGILLILFIIGLYWAQARVDPFVEREPKLERAVTIFRLPVSTALILTLMLSSWLYPQAPRLLSSALGAAALMPVVILLRRIVDKPLFIILYALVTLYFIGLIREVTVALPLVSRLLFLIEMFAAELFLVWFIRSKKLLSRVESRHYGVFRSIRKFLPVALVIFGLAFVANILGFVSLSNLLGSGILRSSYAAIILYAIVEILRSLSIFALRVRPLSSLQMVKSNRHLIRVRFTRITQWVAIVLWALFALAQFSVRDAVFAFMGNVLFSTFTFGSIAISLATVLFFVLVVYGSFLLSRFILFVLEEDVYPRVDIGGGISYAISTVVHYFLLIAGFVIAIAGMGVDLSKFAILAGAIGVGLGFGLQNIINNFVSGLILLFERPVKVGDIVQIGEHQGDLMAIGLRASVLKKTDGSNVIVPNSQLISEEVINWTIADKRRRLDIKVGVAYGTDQTLVLDLLTKATEGNRSVLAEPKPRALFVGFGDFSLDFELRAWTENTDDWVVVRSEIVSQIYRSMKDANIQIVFPRGLLPAAFESGGEPQDVK